MNEILYSRVLHRIIILPAPIYIYSHVTIYHVNVDDVFGYHIVTDNLIQYSLLNLKAMRLRDSDSFPHGNSNSSFSDRM